MKITQLLFTAACLLAVAACESTYKPTSDSSDSYNFTAVKSYNIIGDEAFKNPLLSDIDRGRLDSALNNALVTIGKRATDKEDADVLISYFVVTKDKTKVYDSGLTANNCYRCIYRSHYSSVTVRNYIEGTLVIDMIDNETKKSVWRSSLTKPMKTYETATEKQAAVQKVVDAMVKQLPQN